MFLKSFDWARESSIAPKRHRLPDRGQKGERGQTIFIVAVALVVVLGMAALAVDVTFFYTAHSQAQKAADAAALAGAKAFVTSGFTSGQLGDPASGGAQAIVCNGSSGLADIQALAASKQNKIGSAPATNFTTACNFSVPGNPQITVTLNRPDLPVFFGRIWGNRGVQVSATAKAEAYNPSGQTVPVEVGSVKPWLITNCDYTNQNPALLNPNCPLQLNAGGISVGADYFIDPHNDYAIA
ncbi:MAG: pilus assembly protein TadG-related protein, partial [Terriglobales bacterium]